MSVYSKKTSKSYKSAKSTRTHKSNQSRRSQHSIRPKLLNEIKNKHGFVNSQPWHIRASLLDRIQKPNPFNKLISSHDALSVQMQSSVCSTLSTCIELIVHKKSDHQDTTNRTENNESNETNDWMDTEIDESISVSSTELFAVFMTLLENKNSDTHELSLILLLSHLIPTIPINVLLNKFDDLSQKLSHYFQKNVSSTSSVEYCIHCMSAMLISRITHSEDHFFLTNEWCQKMLQGLFVTSIDEMDKIRKLALKHIKKIFKLYPKDQLPQKIKDLMRCFMERQIEGLLNESNDSTNDLNVIAFIAELLMETLEYLTLKESSYILSLLFNVISYKTQTYGDNRVQFKQLTLQQMFLKLLYKFIKSLPIKFNLKPAAKSTQSSWNHTNIDDLANQLNDKIDLKTLVKNMTLSDETDENENEAQKKKRYVRFVLQLFDVIQQLKPQTTDTVAIPIYFDCLVGIIEALYVFDTQEALQRCISIITIIFDGFESNKKKIVAKASASIVKILELIVNKELIQRTKHKVNGTMNDDQDPDGDDILTPLSAASGLSVSNQTPRNKLPILQRITILIESLFDFKYKSSWMYVYSLCSALFRLFGDLGFFLLQNILNELSEIRLMDEPLYLTSLEDAICSAIQWCGPENVLSVIPLNLPTLDILQLISMDAAILKANLWLLPLLKHNVNRTKLSFFGVKLVPIADSMMKQSAASGQKDMIVHKKQFDAMSHMIWSIFPSFCIYPSDVNETFPKIAESIAYYLMNIVEVRQYIIRGFIHLIRKPLEFIRRENEKGIFGNEMVDKAKQQIETMSRYTENFLPILCNILVQSEHDKRCNVLRAIALFSQVGDTQYIVSHFQRTMIKCLEDDTKLLMLRKEIMDGYNNNNNDEDNTAEGKEDKNKRLEEIKCKYEKLLNQETAYLLILNEMIEFVDIMPLEKFWAFLKQQFMKTDQSPLIQKLLFKNLASILNYKESLLLKDHKQLTNFTKFIIEIHKHGGNKSLCIGARHQRLHCVHTLLDCLAAYEISKVENNAEATVDAFIADNDDDAEEDEDGIKAGDIASMKENPFSFMNVYPQFIGELIESVSLSNLKIRKAALDIIELIALRLDDISSELFDTFVLKLLGGLLSKTSAMQSATILCLTYLIVQFELRIPGHVLSELLKTISLRMEAPANNVIKSSLDFIQIVIQEMPDAILETNLMDLLTTLLKWLNDDTKSNKFKSKINKNLDLLLKRFGYARIIKMVPHRFQRLIKYLRKRADYLANKREEKKKLQRQDKLNQKLFNKQLDELPPDHPLNVPQTRHQQAGTALSDGEDADIEDDDGKLTVFEQLKTERMSSKSRRSLRHGGTRIGDTESVRMRIDGGQDITDLSSKTAIKKQLISEYEANKVMNKEKRMKELGMMQAAEAQHKAKDHIKELPDGRLLITMSDDEDEDHHRRKHKKKWKNLSDDEDMNNEEGSDSDLSDDYNNNYKDERDVDDILSTYSKYNKMTQLKKALADVSRAGSRKSNKRLAANGRDVISKRRRILDSVKNDEWIPGQLQPYRYHMISPALLSRKKRHFRQSAFQRVMGKKRNVVVRTDAMDTNALKISRTRKVGHGRYTLKRSKVKAKQRHLMQDIESKHRQNRMKRRRKSSKSRSKSKKKKRGTKRRLAEM